MNTAPLWALILAAVLSSTVIAGLIGLIGIIYQARNTRPKIAAETLDLGIDAQNDIMASLRAEVARSRDRATAAEERAEKLEERVDELEEALAQVRTQWMESRRRERKLAEHNQALAAWCEQLYQAEHLNGMKPPPKLADFDMRPIYWLSTRKHPAVKEE